MSRELHATIAVFRAWPFKLANLRAAAAQHQQGAWGQGAEEEWERARGSVASAGCVELGVKGVREEGKAGEEGASSCMEQRGVREEAAQWQQGVWGKDFR